MPNRLVLGSLVVLMGCGKPAHDGGADDGGSALTDAGEADSGGDVGPPMLLAVSPPSGSAIWLHAPIRLDFDQPVDVPAVSAELDGAAIPAHIALIGDRSLAVTLPAELHGVGALKVHVGSRELSYTVPAWSSVPVDLGVLGVAQTPPQLAVGDDGTVLAAWLVGGRVVVAFLDGATWQVLGEPLGSGVASYALAFDGGSPLVAWSAGEQAHVARWTGAWTALPSPGGNAAAVALAVPPGGAPMIALVGATATVRELVGGAWQTIGLELPLPAALASEPVLAACAAGRPAIGWIDNTAQLRVFRYDSGWTAISPLSVTVGSHVSLAAHGGTLAIAWDQRAGSWGVLAASAPELATSWTLLGRALDIDIAGDAVAPAITFDATGAPIVAWSELVETEQRGGLARWSGTGWTIEGGVSWLESPTAKPTVTRIALHAGESPVVATTAAGRVDVARFNGPRIAGFGLATRASIAGCTFSATNPPALLSQTGCFTFTTPARPAAHPGLVPYDVVTELWVDGAKKRRWIGLPDGATMTPIANGSWTAPAGTIMIKEFSLETTPGDPSTRRAIETRFLVNDASSGWHGFSYRWNPAGTDATLLPNTLTTYDWPMDDGSVHTHLYPSRDHCSSCHYYAYGPLLGLRAAQLARWYDYGGVIADQLATLSHLGVSPTASGQPFVSPHEPSETWEHRTRGYMAGNCAHCHNPDYISIKDLRYTTPLAQTRLCEAIVPGSPTDSKVYQLVTSRPGMPALGTLAVDPLAQELLSNWITGMTSCP